ncbi:AfsR/SARP family transcriptional regulator [Phytoactinopolyspora endophytica]|uniref:AfsR/SARP family transcriptional regulator n=1 Tax=Phytoactinopolyspora endophytica TaxID=1642495 RepID=UPI0013EDEF48|nr:BTAD domain-containing putative transcriptional regulator [Phytoactinopolyspora endophytica]
MSSARLEVSLLGTVEASRDGAPTPLPPGRPTVILAALALRAGHVVPLDVLVDYLWPDGRPKRPKATIQTHVARLRAALDESVIHAVGDGYCLDVPPDAVDILRFRDMVATASQLDEPATELKHLQVALALWRGEPLSGLAPDTLQQESAPLLVEELLATTERVNDLRLRLAELDDEFVPSLRRLVTGHPWREKLWAQLLLALYRQGRRGEALSAYHELVTVLKNDLGIEPGPEVAELHARILASDQELLARPEPRRTAVVPFQLPRPPADVVGRDQEVDLLTSTLSASRPWARLCVVSGPGGSGKTTLALRAGHAVRDAHPDGQLFAELRGSSAPVNPADVLADFLRALGIDSDDIPPTAHERSSLFRSVCAGRRLLVVLDDAHDAAQIMPLLPGADGCSVLVTSRPRLSVIPADIQIDLSMLDDGAAHELLASIAGHARLDVEPDAANTIIDACQGSPLALRIAGGRLAVRPSWPVNHLAERLRGESRLDELQIGDLSVRAVIDASFQILDQMTADRFQLLAAVPGATVDVEAASVLWETGGELARDCLEQLVDIRLLDSPSPGDYRWHDLVGDYMRGLLGRDRADHARRLLATYYLRTLYNTLPVLRPDGPPPQDEPCFPDEVDGRSFRDRDEIHAWLHPRRPVLVALGRHGLRSGDPAVVDEAAALMLALNQAEHECCRDARPDLVHRVLDALDRIGSQELVARAWYSVALSLGNQNRSQEALDAATHALKARRRLGDRRGEMTTLHNMAVYYALGHRFEEAAELFEQCAAATDLLTPRIQTRSLRNLADVQVSLGRYDEARRNLEETAKAVDDWESVDAFEQVSALAHLYTETGDTARAIAEHERAIAIAIALDSAALHAAALVNAAHGRRVTGQSWHDDAAAALELARQTQMADVEAEALQELGHDAMRLGDRQGAEKCWREALEIFTSLRAAEADGVRTLLEDLHSTPLPPDLPTSAK